MIVEKKKIIFLVCFITTLNGNATSDIQDNHDTMIEIDDAIVNDILLSCCSEYAQTTPAEIIDSCQGDSMDSATRILPVKQKKYVTFMVYMAADNNLAFFGRKNLDQESQIGSNAHINIVTELDTKLNGNQKVTKVYYVEKNKLVLLNDKGPDAQARDSGDPENLIRFCKFAITHFPAEHYVLILWNHGMGIIDIGQYNAFNSSKLFRFNTTTNMLELNRSIPFLEFVTQSLPDPRGLCFDDSTGHYISNQGLEYALKTICQDCLEGKKFDIIGFDACLMSMLEIGNIIKDYADYMVGSQEVELALGWRYDLVLSPFLQQKVPMKQFAQHIVKAYHQMYSPITKDYTQSAIDLSLLDAIEENVDQVATSLLEALQNEKSNTIRDALKASRHKLFCTQFVEQSFVDIAHVYQNILNNLGKFQFKDQHKGNATKKTLGTALQQVIDLMQQAVIANVAGGNLRKAQGLSIYFPEKRIHSSYLYTKFAQTNNWHSLITAYTKL